ncbi:hypothetical protein IFM89_001145 [Coptis chinensis]|uniref:SWIM-type domain-containing protein n=1 Tax=Coptis chinensis TaxID=261450 RepID=A0A835ILF3_9MAGN|nr:hypothetical protein IFM89_001145 [Coptis chinensis]
MASFTEKIGDIVKTDQKAADWLDSEERSCWTRAYFDHTCKCDEMTNNFSESFNSWILKMRDKLLVQFVDMYNLSLVKLMYDRMMVSRELGDYDVIVPTVLHIIKKREAKYKNYKVSGVSDHINLVQNTKNKKHYCVDLEKKTCECIVWKMSGVPCVHAICVIRQRRDKWSKYCSKYFTAKAFKSTYFTHIHPIANQEDWEIIIDHEDLVNPHEFKPQVGRPKKQRIRDEDEPQATSKVLRKCGKCGELNHNTRTCDARKNGTRPKKRATPPSVQQQVPPQQQQAPQNVQQQQRARSTRKGWLSWFEASGA